MTRVAGYLLVGFSVFHFIMTVVLFGTGIAKIAEAGLFGGLAWNMEAHTAFWFALLSVPYGLLGILILAVWADIGRLPAGKTISVGIIASVLLAGLILPASGYWAFLIPGVLLGLDRKEV